MAKIKKKKKTDPKTTYVLKLSEKEAKLLAAVLDFPDWAANGELGDRLETLHDKFGAVGIDGNAYVTFKSSKASFLKG